MKSSAIRISFGFVIAAIATLLLGACSVSVQDKGKEQKNEKVDIQTPFADLKINTDASAADNGIPVYPGAHLRPKENGDSHAANINIGGFGFGLKVIAAEYETDDAPEKVKAFYEDKLKKFGDVLVCTGHEGGSDVQVGKHGEGSEKLSCQGAHGDGWEVKVGTSDNEHLVSIEPRGSGTRFGTVLVQTHGKEGAL
jgi:hypothetical protein